MSLAVREGHEGDAVLGVRPKLVFTPDSVEEAAEVMARCARDAARMLFVGGGTDLEAGHPPEAIDAVLLTRGLGRILEHAPSDQIVVAEAGVPLALLQQVVGEHGQRLALDPPLPERATLGGLVAGNAFGPLRARYGSIRDLIIGVSILRADGTGSRGGGKVVKTVAGFDIPKLMVGSLGTLGLISTVTFRLHPLPETSAMVLVPGCSAAVLRGLVREMRRVQLEPASAVAILAGPGTFDLAVQFEGFAAGVRQQRDRFLSLLAGRGAANGQVADRASADDFRARHDAVRGPSSLRVKIAAPRSAVESVAADVFAPILATLHDAGAVWYPTLGLGFLGGASGPADPAASALSRARSTLAAFGGSLTLTAAPAEVRALVDVWGDRPSAWPLMQAMKSRLDPDRRLAPGRFMGAI
ncbi:MAG: FAD-binding oxidoreductase [Acidobacteriota bacterium]|nr:FAD-binding oxidoreductase [Acidobacteriota bacterium]